MPPTPPQPQVHAGTLWVERTFPASLSPNGQEQTNGETTRLETKLFAVQPAVVKASVGRTINTGNYESIRIEVGVELPCYPEEVQQGVDYASELVSTFVQNEENAVRQLIRDAQQKARDAQQEKKNG